jgi:hypothetical protein
MGLREELASIKTRLAGVEATSLPAPEIKKYLGPTLSKFTLARAQIQGSLRAKYWDQTSPEGLKLTIGKEAFARWRMAVNVLGTATRKLARFTFEVRKVRRRPVLYVIERPVNEAERKERLKALKEREKKLAERAEALNTMMVELKRELLPIVKTAHEDLSSVVRKLVEQARAAAIDKLGSTLEGSATRSKIEKLIDRGDEQWLNMDAVEGARVLACAQKAWERYTRCLRRFSR